MIGERATMEGKMIVIKFVIGADIENDIQS